MTDRPAIAIAAGGTAGHVNPALALAEELRSRGCEVRFFGDERRLEGRLVPEAGFAFHPLHVTGFDRRRPWTLAGAVVRLDRERRRLARTFRRDPQMRPDAAIGFGAYVELPLIQAAADAGIPVAIHEQNSVPGLANRRSSSRAQLIAIAHPQVAEAFRRAGADPETIRVTGNPVRASVLAGDRGRGRARLGWPEGAPALLAFGGSLGAHHLNEALARLKRPLLSIEGLRILHATGARDYEATRTLLALSDEEATRYRVQPYVEDMGDMLAAADAVVSRAGASSIAEIAALAVPAMLVPFPFATGDHQTTNARLLADAGAAFLCADAELDGEDFARHLLELVGDAALRARMREAARGLGGAAAAARLADAVLALVM